MIDRRPMDRSRDEYRPRGEEKGSFSRRSAPPSRHLWVGNLSPRLTEAVIREHFLRYGEIESVAFIPGRSYAFINFRKEEDAIIAMRALQGFVVGGLPMKIEFTKGERQLPSSAGEGNLQSRDRAYRSAEQGDAFPQRDSRTNYDNYEKYSDKLKDDRCMEPSDVLWIGFPSFLNVDESTLRRAFSPYGEIDKVTAFPGRSYAFVQFKSVISACRAKDALQGKLFNNPRVNITFAKSELGPSEHVRGSTTSHPFPHHMKFDDSPQLEASPRMAPNFDRPRDSALTGFGQIRMGSSSLFEPVKLPGIDEEWRHSEDIYEQHRSGPIIDRGGARHDFPPLRPPRRSVFDEPWDGPDDPSIFQAAKKLKTGPYSDNELPEYPFSDSHQEKLLGGHPRLFSNRNFGSGPFESSQMPDYPKNSAYQHLERDEPWKTHGHFESDPGSLPSKSLTEQRFAPEPQQSPSAEVWKWEGTIAKGGTPVCRARCFPVGKVLDFMLPEFLNCTARTDLDMLAKHFYQATSFWVVFFVAGSDSDIVYYNEFMRYLEERQRAAVAKLSERTTLFLVPPSDFSEKVLKVPGKMSISGVILSFHDASSGFDSFPHPMDALSSKPSLLSESSLQKSNSPDPRSSLWDKNYTSTSLEHLPPSTSSFPNFQKTGSTNYPGEKASDTLNESRHNQSQHQNPPVTTSNWSPHQAHNLHSAKGKFSSQSYSFEDPGQDYNKLKQDHMQGTNSSQFTSGNSNLPRSGSRFSQHETKPQSTSSAQIPPLQPEQLAQLASLLGQRQQQVKLPLMSSGADHNQASLISQMEPALSARKPATFQNVASGSPSNPPTSQLARIQQSQTASEFPTGTSESGVSQQIQNSGREESDADPQKRLQATLQLAAALLQQIQQQTKSVS